MENYFNTLIQAEAKRLNMSELEVIDTARKLLSKVAPKELPFVPPNQLDLEDAIKEATEGKSLNQIIC